MNSFWIFHCSVCMLFGFAVISMIWKKKTCFKKFNNNNNNNNKILISYSYQGCENMAKEIDDIEEDDDLLQQFSDDDYHFDDDVFLSF